MNEKITQQLNINNPPGFAQRGLHKACHCLFRALAGDMPALAQVGSA
jgi:hypothetical protein